MTLYNSVPSIFLGTGFFKLKNQIKMSTLPILEIPDPTLRKRAKRIRGLDKSMLKLAYDMVDTMHEAGGIGLAANQVGHLWRVIVNQMPEEEEARIYFNPEIVRTVGTREVEEGCLSLPGYRGLVNRSVCIRFQATDHSETTVKFKAEDLLSQALEHEVDHLNGILYTDHLVSHEQLYRIDEQEFSTERDEEKISGDQNSLDTPASLKIK